ncbi:class D sortase [Pueribacillus sp. YX66]|uniref:class D sortase n=1 Tax=Pueribacillus sp. YX66 TaxID=3229242 RepID=UPI00358CE4E5
MRKLGLVFLILGVGIVARYSYEYWQAMKSVNVAGSEANASTVHQQPAFSEADLVDTLGAKPNFDIGEGVANLVIPKINTSYEVYWGTDEHTLSKGVGMYVSEWTVPPDGERHTVLSGHRDTVFRPLGELEDGDRLFVSYLGVDYEYEINKIWITHAEDRTVIVEKEEPTLTLTTCYPFNYIGSAPDRYIIQANLVQKGKLL